MYDISGFVIIFGDADPILTSLFNVVMLYRDPLPGGCGVKGSEGLDDESLNKLNGLRSF